MVSQLDETSSSSDQPVKTVLVVEDDQDIGEFFVQALQLETPYQALLAPDGFRALEIMKSIKPSVIVVDYGLPSMNGIVFYDYLKSIKVFADIPVLLVSAQVPTQEAKKRNIPYLKKPVELEQLLSTIDKMLS